MRKKPHWIVDFLIGVSAATVLLAMIALVIGALFGAVSLVVWAVL